MPPVTITQLESWISGYGLKRDYVSWDDISTNAKLAAIAGEDQLFPIHNGFDWKAIDKSLNNNLQKTEELPALQQAPSVSKQQKIFFYFRVKEYCVM